MEKTKKVLKIVGNILLWLFVVFAVLVTVLVFSAQGNKDGLANIMGKSMITVSSDSMKPEFKKGDLIIDEILTNDEKQNCKVGDIITFYFDANDDGEALEFNTHRIVETYEESGYTYYVTRGDNHEMSTGNDAPVISTKVVGKYTGTKVPVVGSIIGFIQTSTGFLCVIVLPLVLFFLFELYNFIVIVVRIRSKNKLTAEDEEEIKKRAVEEYLRQQEQNNSTEESKIADASESSDK